MIMLLGFAGYLVFFMLRLAILLTVYTAIGCFYVCRLAVLAVMAAARVFTRAVASQAERRAGSQAGHPENPGAAPLPVAAGERLFI